MGIQYSGQINIDRKIFLVSLAKLYFAFFIIQGSCKRKIEHRYFLCA
ncbi:hypothetical protein EMUCRT_0764 [Ehrlichia cf. muris str. EmCRT]|uniref:Uncharacterized protein n=1 Tax=Ehrlichia cf. muris str. EmCRT TaxID=1359167 RepID=A0A0F3N5G7_9RICK|nr:hypothetical protein EMUCRT_0764 [Ehrlichia cf. muris str. EmCRT]